MTTISHRNIMTNVNIHLNKQEMEIIQKKKEMLGYSSDYACVKAECLKSQDKVVPLEVEVQTKSTSELEKLFNRLTDSDKESIKTKKNASWFFERFFNDIHDLYKHKCPPAEFIDTCVRYNAISIVIAEILRRRGETLQTWDNLHRLTARIKPFDYSFMENKPTRVYASGGGDGR